MCKASHHLSCATGSPGDSQHAVLLCGFFRTNADQALILQMSAKSRLGTARLAPDRGAINLQGAAAVSEKRFSQASSCCCVMQGITRLQMRPSKHQDRAPRVRLFPILHAELLRAK